MSGSKRSTERQNAGLPDSRYLTSHRPAGTTIKCVGINSIRSTRSFNRWGPDAFAAAAARGGPSVTDTVHQKVRFALARSSTISAIIDGVGRDTGFVAARRRRGGCR